jgi:hypothetical protein
MNYLMKLYLKLRFVYLILTLKKIQSSRTAAHHRSNPHASKTSVDSNTVRSQAYLKLPSGVYRPRLGVYIPHSGPR